METEPTTMSSRRRGTPARILLLAAAIVLADQVVKLIVVQTVRLGASIDVVGSIVRLTHTSNTGAAFGLFRGGGAWFIWISAVASIAIIAFTREIAKMRFWERTAFGLVLGGAVGNLIDRVRLGAVVDFLDIGFGAARWPAFNVADSAISVGVVILAIHIVFLSGSRSSESLAARRESE